MKIAHRSHFFCFIGAVVSLINNSNINIMDVSGQWCSLACRSIRIGSYKVQPKEKITITQKGIQIQVPGIVNPTEVVTISLSKNDILKVLAHFSKSMPLLSLYISSSACQKTRNLLGMTSRQSFYLDVQSADETQKRITILPEKLTEDIKMILKQHFSVKVQELESSYAEEILVRSSPKDFLSLKSKMPGGQTSSTEKKGTEGSVNYNCQYLLDIASSVAKIPLDALFSGVKNNGTAKDILQSDEGKR